MDVIQGVLDVTQEVQVYPRGMDVIQEVYPRGMGVTQEVYTQEV